MPQLTASSATASPAASSVSGRANTNETGRRSSMSSGSNNHSRKRPLEISGTNNNDTPANTSSRATQAQEVKRRQIQQASWGFREVLTECGLLEFATSSSLGDGDDEVATAKDSARCEVGCQLEPKVSPSTLRSSLHALLHEMSKNGIDPNNERVLKDMEDLILGTGEGDENAAAAEEREGNVAGTTRGTLLRRMLLPLYRVRNKQNRNQHYDFSQFTQPDMDEDGNITTTPDNNTKGSGGSSATKTIVESSSLIKVLLRVDVLQPTLLTALMQKLPELASPTDDEEGTNAATGLDDDVPRLIFSNMRWLDHIVDYSSLTNSFVECLTILASSSSSCTKTRGILLDAIATLPDVLNDSNALCGGVTFGGSSNGDGDAENENEEEEDESCNNGNPILQTLQLLRVEDPTLLVPCLDAIGSLPLTEDQILDVTRDALEALANVERWGLPALTTFLMNHCPSGTSGGGKGLAREVIEEMRKLPLGSSGGGGADEDEEENGMDLDETHRGTHRSSHRGNGAPSASNSASASSCLMIESLSRGFAHRPDLTSTLIKVIKDTPITGYHPPADIWLLACCAAAPHNRTKVKSLFKSKANCGMFTSRLLRESLSGNGMALTSLFGTSLCDLADGLLRSSGASCSDAGAPGGCSVGAGLGPACELGVTLYEILFAEFSEPMQRQEIVGSLVTHVGSGVNVKPSEVDAALRVFCGIVDNKRKTASVEAEDGGASASVAEDGATALRPFTPFLTSMLDHLHHMTPSQVRRLFLLLFAVGGSAGDDVDGQDNRLLGGASAGAGGGACDDVHIVIRKHLSLAPFTMKRIGIIGTVAYAVSRSSQLQEREAIIDDENNMLAETEATCLPGSAAVASSPVVKEIREMIETAYQHCKPAGNGAGNNGSSGFGNSSVGAAFSDGSAMAFMFDELCHAVRGGRLATPIRQWINELIQDDFESVYVGDFEEPDDEMGTQQQKGGTKGMGKSDGEHDVLALEGDQAMIPTCSRDLALLNGSSTNAMAPPAELRFNIAGAESVVYVKILSLLSSQDRNEREVMPVQLSPMFRLMSTLNDMRYGGKGLSEIDAMLECPLLLPTSECSGIDFEDLSPTKQWVVTSSYFVATEWIRQLINSFIYAANDSAPSSASSTAAAGHVGSFTSSSQGFNCDEVQKKIVARLNALVELEEELRFTSSKCFNFSPPGLDVLPAAKELYDDGYPNEDAENTVNMNIDPKDMSKEDKKALAKAKKNAIKRAKDRVKSKQKRLKARQKHEEQLVSRTLGALRQLDPQVCVALGFAELSVMGNTDADGSSQGLSQFQQVTNCGGPVTTLLLNQLDKTLSNALFEKKGLAFKARMEGSAGIDDDADNDNPYMGKEETCVNNATNFAGIALASCEESSKKSFALLDNFLKGGVFASLYEYLAAVAELRCGPNRKSDDAETEKQLVKTARCVFSCVKSLVSSELLTRSPTGRYFLAAVLKQMAEGDREDYKSDTKRRRISLDNMNKLLGFITDNVNEIVTGAYTGDLEFAMDGMHCMQAILECSQRISDAIEVKKGDDDDSPSFQSKLSEVSAKLLRQHWPEDTKMNKGNIGKLLSLLIEHSSDRMKTLSHLVNDVLSEVPFLEKGSGVTIFPTCSHHTFGNYYSTVLEHLWKELVNLFDSPLGKTKDHSVASRALERLQEMMGLLKSLFHLTKEHDSLAKKFILLQQLKFGSRFIETYVLKAIPFFQIHFQHFEEGILDNIKQLQSWSRQLYYIISHGKREKDASLAKEAPRAKKALEMFIHKVKAMLKKNRCMTAMWTKTLKAKDIDGTLIKEEKTSREDEEEGDSQDEDEEDDSEEDGDDAASDDTSEGEYESDED